MPNRINQQETPYPIEYLLSETSVIFIIIHGKAKQFTISNRGECFNKGVREAMFESFGNVANTAVQIQMQLKV
ncbi:hypothetical protein ACTXT7_000808 [Hymenolepis weldensis]